MRETLYDEPLSAGAPHCICAGQALEQGASGEQDVDQLAEHFLRADR
jgi:hypothetical protein